MSENEFSVNEFIVREIGYTGAIKQEVVGELVRCADCKSGRPYKHTKEYVACEVDVEPVDRDKDFFCAYGKRREDEQQP